MSSDSRSWFLDSPKKKLKKILPSNITSGSIPGRIVSDETKNKIRNFANNTIEKTGTGTFISEVKNKAQNITNKVIEQTGAGAFINGTKTRFKEIFSSDDNSTIPKGFFDSLFSPQTADDVYLKTAIICLWTIAMLCIISTIIAMFKGITKKEERTTGIRRFLIHIFLCEFCYLIYILLSMINVALDFKLNFFFCGIGKYGMYATVPIMYFVLVVLSFERVTSHCKKSANKLFENMFIIQPILFFVWFCGIGIISLLIFIKRQIKELPLSLPGKRFLRRLGPFGTIFLPGRCSIDGQLLPAFKILFVFLFILLIILIIKSLAYTVIYSFFTPSFCEGKNKSKNKNKDHRTLIFILILLLNLVFSFPFYLISTANSILDTIQGDKPFPMTLKFSFILRLISIILQCFVFLTLETNSWKLLNQLIHFINCKKCAMLTRQTTHPKKQPVYRELRPVNHSANKGKPVRPPTKPDTNKDDVSSILTVTDDEGSDNDSVFQDNLPNGQVNTKKSETKENSTTDSDDSDHETKPVPTRTSFTNKNEITKKSSHTKNNKENEPLKKPTSKHNHTNGISKSITNEKLASQQTSSATTDKKTSKSNTNGNLTNRVSSLSELPTEDISDVSVNSDDGIKPTITKPKVQTITRSNSDKQNHPPMVSSNNHQRPRRPRSKVSRPIKSTLYNHTHTRTPVNRRKSPRNVNNHIEQPKQDRLSKIIAQSDEV